MSVLGVICAAGKGTRLRPATNFINKHLLPIYNKPMIYYPLSNLIMLGCRRVKIVINDSDIKQFKDIQKHINSMGILVELVFQGKEQGIPSAIRDAIVGEKAETIYVMLGDNIFFGSGFIDKILKDSSPNLTVVKTVRNPKEFGVLHQTNEGLKITEKPKIDLGNKAVTGLYRFNRNYSDEFLNLKVSKRNETEIADVLNNLLEKNALGILELTRATLWLDAGNFDGLLKSSNFVSILNERQGQDFGVVEESALQMGLIEKNQLQLLIRHYVDNDYKFYLERLFDG